MSVGTHEAIFYVQIRAHRYSWSSMVRALTAVRVTKSKPVTLLDRCVAVKITMRIPDAAFEPFSPEVVIDVPIELVQRPIEVEAGDASN